MKVIRLVREVTHPANSGPFQGQFALQKQLRRRAPKWLAVGGAVRCGEIPWFWCWLDRLAAVEWARQKRPFIIGPNILFDLSHRPMEGPGEREMCQAASCRLMFTESAWYRDLIEQYRGPENKAPIVLWPYPIDPQPGGPLPAEYDVLIYVKSGRGYALAEQLVSRWPRSRIVTYGRYRREELIDAARVSRACLYLSDDDRGPLALAEILLAGCPAVGIPRGSPWITTGVTGYWANGFRPESFISAVGQAQSLDREAVRDAALRQFDTDAILQLILTSLRRVVDR